MAAARAALQSGGQRCQVHATRWYGDDSLRRYAFKSVVRSVAEGDEEARFRVFSGCAGWSPKQLEGEIRRGDWLLHDASAEFVFHKDPYEVWDTLMHTFQKAHQLVAAANQHPEWN